MDAVLTRGWKNRFAPAFRRSFWITGVTECRIVDKPEYAGRAGFQPQRFPERLHRSEGKAAAPELVCQCAHVHAQVRERRDKIELAGTILEKQAFAQNALKSLPHGF